MNNKKIIRYDTQTGEPIYEKKKIIRYDTQTGNPIYEDTTNVQQVNNSLNISNNQNISQMNNQPVNSYNQYLNNNINQQSNIQKNNQPTNIYNSDLNKNKNNKVVSILVSSLLVVLIIVVVAITVYLLDKKSDNKENSGTVNEYENNTKITNDKQNTSDTNTQDSSDAITLNGFKFKKVSGYDYSISEEALEVENDDYYMYINVSNIDYSLLQGNYDVFSETFKEEGIIVNSYGSKIISGQELMYFDVVQDGFKMLACITKTPEDGYVYMGMITKFDNNVSTDDLDELIKILNNSSYVGTSSSYSSSTEFNFDLNKIKSE